MRTLRRLTGALVVLGVVVLGACDRKQLKTTPEAGDAPRDGSGKAGTPRPAEPAPTLGGCDVSAPASREVAAPQLRMTLPGSGEESWFASPTLVDLDGDGRLDIAAARHGMLFAWKHDGTPLWRTAFGHSVDGSPAHGDRRMWASPSAADVTGDGRNELVVASDIQPTGGNVAVYDQNGRLLPGWPARFGNTEIRSVAAADVTGTGQASVLVNKLHDGPSTAVLGVDGQLLPGWPQVTAACHPTAAPPCLDYGGYNQNIGAADLDGDGVADVVTTYDLMAFGIFRGNGVPFPAAAEFSDDVVTGIEAYHDITFARQGWGVGDRSEFTDSPPVMADLDGDGKREIILLGHHEHSESTQHRGFTLWVVRPDGTRPPGWEWPKDLGPSLRTEDNDPGHNIVLQLPSVTVGDVDPSPGLEIVFPSSDGFVYAFSAGGEQLWRHAVGSAWPFVGISEPVIADLNADGRPEILFTTWVSGAPGAPEAQPHLYVLAADGVVLHQLPISGRGAMGAPSVADLDGDGAVEIVISLKDPVADGMTGVQVWTVPGSDGRCMPWPTGRGNVARTGAAPAASNTLSR